MDNQHLEEQLENEEIKVVVEEVSTQTQNLRVDELDMLMQQYSMSRPCNLLLCGKCMKNTGIIISLACIISLIIFLIVWFTYIDKL